MNYLLAVLTCGRPEYLTRTLRAYADFLHPSPSAMYVWDDGLQTPHEAFAPFAHLNPVIEGERKRIGRCSGHAKLWKSLSRPDFADIEWVFTVEDDIVLLRPLNVMHLGELLIAEEHLEQIALVRCPWGAEVEVGGYIPLFPDRYERRTTKVSQAREARWIASTIDWTSSPALLPAILPRELDWPGGHGCELELGPRILSMRPDAVSGYWGWGEPWCSHIGMARVAGGHGY